MNSLQEFLLADFYPRKWLIPRGADGSFDKDCVRPPANIITHNDEHWIYYAGMDERHYSVGRHLNIGLAKLRLDGFICLQAKDTPGWFGSDQPSALSYYIACMMRWMTLYPAQADRSWFQLSDTPHLRQLLLQLEARPATRAAIAAEGLGVAPFTAPSYATPPEGSAT